MVRASGTEDPRAAARALLGSVLAGRQPLTDIPDGGAGPLAGLDGPARARALRLARSTLRNLDRADALLSPLLRRLPPDPVRQALRLAVVERFVEGAPAHAVVDAAVGAVRRGHGGARLAGLVNAVLRKALDMPQAEWEALPVPRLPAWLRAPLLRRYGRAGVAAMEAAHLAGARLDLTPRDPDSAPALAEALGGRLLPTGSLRLAAGSQVSALPGFAEGQWWVQDAAAALPARLLAPSPGARVLDLCAAPGGKTLQLAAAGAQVTALDLSPMRLERLRANLARTGLAAEVVAADALEWQPPAPFDAILLDAPCSASGTIRRHPDMPHVRDAAALPGLIALQSALIDRAVGWLRPGGRLVYCTCSLLWEEGEGQARAALERHPVLAVADGAQPEGVPRDWRSSEGGWRMRPDHWPEAGGMDGFYMIAFERGA